MHNYITPFPFFCGVHNPFHTNIMSCDSFISKGRLTWCRRGWKALGNPFDTALSSDFFGSDTTLGDMIAPVV